MKTIAVIGGGASGMMTAITAASEGARVILLEHADQVGKKILSTGNGRCNFTNTMQEPFCYNSDNLLFPWRLIERFGTQDTIAFFLRLGVYSKNRNGYIYPNSDQASAVADVLRMEMERLRVDIRTGIECRKIIPWKKHFRIITDRDDVRADRVILCAGSKAAPNTGSDGSGYDLAKDLGHRIIPVLPALVQLRCREKFMKSIAGVRVNGQVSLYCGDECMAANTGEIQLTSYGISGIPVFQVSRWASRALYEGKEVTALLDFMPDFTFEQTLTFLKARVSMRPEKHAEDFLTGLFHRKLSELWIRLSGIGRKKTAGEFTDTDLEHLCGLIKRFRTTVTAANSFEQAQVCCGGIDTEEVNPDTLESLYIPGLYFAGEILDVDGICGGYNLQWAWTSGHISGKEAAHDQDQSA